MKIHPLVFATLALGSVTTAWLGCSATPDGTTTQGGTAGEGGSGGTTTTGELGGTDFDGGTTTTDAGTCVSTSAVAERVPLDMIFLIDRSSSMKGAKWSGITSALTKFFSDPKSIKIGVGISYFPNFLPDACDPEGYKLLQVPIGVLPANTFPLTNSIPAEPTGSPTGTPTHPALKGVLQAATAYQDAHPTHKVIVVLATDGDPHVCGPTSIPVIADLVASALGYNGVRTFAIGAEGSTIANLDKIAAAGGTEAAYDVTSDISEFSAKVNEIRNQSLGCEFEIPPLPSGKDLDPDEVNFSYTPGGMGDPKVLLRAHDLADCLGKPGWYFDSNAAPTKIVLCPASCATVQADDAAEVNALFGCQSQVN